MLKDYVFIQRNRNTLQNILFATVLIVSGYFIVNPRATFRWIPTENQTKVLNKIAATIHTHGDVRRKLVNDLLWLPVEDRMQLYYGDSIFSSGDSSVEIVFSEKQSIVLKENCLVRIGLFQGKPLVSLFTGEFTVQVKKPEVIYVREGSGAAKEKALTAGAPQTVSARKTAQPDTAAKDSKATAAAEPPEKTKDESATPQPTKAKPSLASADFKPYPPEGTVFLHFGNGEIRVSSEVPCTDPCELQVSSKQVHLKQDFKAGEIPQLRIKVSAALSDVIEWSLTDGSKSFHSQFEVHPYNEAFFKKALSDQRQVEVIGN